MKRLLSILILVALSISCSSSLRPVSSGSTLNTIDAGRSVVFVDEKPLLKTPLGGDFIYPAGAYLPVAEDDSGVFFKAPDRVIAGSGFTNGGIYLAYSDPGTAWLWFDGPGGAFVHPSRPENFKFHLRPQ